ncbi:MAG: MFS transporter [Verrucomicrobiae bacterium]|nr:MFS transporter [Verrucomicrobiae bacterium]
MTTMEWIEPRGPRWFNLRVLAWGFYDCGLTIFSTLVISRYFGPWIIQQLGGSVFSFNVTLSASMLVSGFLQILLAPISDELGRRRIFVVFFTCVCAGACALLRCVNTSLVAGLALFALANVGAQTAFVFYNAMLSDVSDARHRARISGIGVALGYVGAVLGLALSERVVNAAPEVHIYRPIFPVAALLVFVFALPLFLFVKEKPGLVRFNLGQSLRSSLGVFVTTLRRVGSHREMMLFFLACLLCLDAVETVKANLALYCQTLVGLDPARGFDFPLAWKGNVLFRLTLSEINLFIVVSTVFAIFGAPLVGHISDKTSHYRAMLWVLALWMVALVLAMFSVQRRLFWVTGPLFGLCFGGMWTVMRAHLLEICHPEERGQMFAIFGFVGRCAAVIGPLAWGLTFTQFEPVFGERKAYRLAIGAILLLMAIGFWIMLYARPREARWRR